MFTSPPGSALGRIAVLYTDFVGITRMVEVGGIPYFVTVEPDGTVLNSSQLVASSTVRVAISEVPEPASLTLVGVGLMTLAWRTRRVNGSGVTYRGHPRK